MKNHCRFHGMSALALTGQLTDAAMEQLRQHVMLCPRCAEELHACGEHRAANPPKGMQARFIERARAEGIPLRPSCVPSRPQQALNLLGAATAIMLASAMLYSSSVSRTSKTPANPEQQQAVMAQPTPDVLAAAAHNTIAHHGHPVPAASEHALHTTPHRSLRAQTAAGREAPGPAEASPADGPLHKPPLLLHSSLSIETLAGISFQQFRAPARLVTVAELFPAGPVPNHPFSFHFDRDPGTPPPELAGLRFDWRPVEHRATNQNSAPQ